MKTKHFTSTLCTFLGSHECFHLQISPLLEYFLTREKDAGKKLIWASRSSWLVKRQNLLFPYPPFIHHQVIIRDEKWELIERLNRWTNDVLKNQVKFLSFPLIMGTIKSKMKTSTNFESADFRDYWHLSTCWPKQPSDSKQHKTSKYLYFGSLST